MARKAVHLACSSSDLTTMETRVNVCTSGTSVKGKEATSTLREGRMLCARIEQMQSN